MGIGLGDDLVQQNVVEFGHVHQLRPRPFQCWSELRHEVTHAGFATGNAIDEERSHERPAQTWTEAHRVIDLLGSRDAVIYQPQRLAPQRLHQSIGDEAVDLFRKHQRVHADLLVHLACTLFGRLARLVAAADFDERHQVHGVERVTHDESLGEVHVLLDLCRQQARGGGAEHHVRCSSFAGAGEQLLLQLQPLGCTLLHEVDVSDGFLRRRDEGECALLG